MLKCLKNLKKNEKNNNNFLIKFSKYVLKSDF